MRVDRQTDRQTDIVVKILRIPPGSEVEIQSLWLESVKIHRPAVSLTCLPVITEQRYFTIWKIAFYCHLQLAIGIPRVITNGQYGIQRKGAV